jgi:hypothetical protein
MVEVITMGSIGIEPKKINTSIIRVMRIHQSSPALLMVSIVSVNSVPAIIIAHSLHH